MYIKKIMQIPIKNDYIYFSYYEPSINDSKYMSNNKEYFILNLFNLKIF